MTLLYETHGERGIPVLLSAGLGGLGAYWAPQMAALTARHRVITYDQRGTGRNRAALPENYNIADMADDVLGVLDDAGCESCHFVGHALGGLIGLDLALRHADRLASLVVVNAWAKLDPHTARCFAVRQDLLLHVGVAAYVQAQPIFLHPAAWLSANAERVAREEAHGVAGFQGTETLLRRIGALRKFDVADRLGDITARTLVMATRDDMLVPYTCSEALARGLPHATLDITETGGHASSVTDPAPFDARLLAFLPPSSRGRGRGRGETPP